jgi:hypothetical protein
LTARFLALDRRTVGDLVMMRRQLLNLKKLAEATLLCGTGCVSIRDLRSDPMARAVARGNV